MIKNTLKKILPRRTVVFLKSFVAWGSWQLIRIFSLHPRLSSLYYAFFSKAFDKEHHSVLSGRYRYLEIQASSTISTNPLLRRNIHRLEKGLIMQPRKEVFAEGYIQETVSAFSQVRASKAGSSLEAQWAEDVLTRYFEVVSSTPTIKNAFALFENSKNNKTSNKTPYTHKEKPATTISPEEIKALFLRRRSTRWFHDKSIEPAKLDEAIELALLAPSACNRQPFEFMVSKSKEQATKLAKLAVGTAGFCENIPQLIAIVGDLSAYESEKDRHLIYIDSSLASMQLMLALEVLGVSSCPLNWPEINWREQEVAKFLNLADEKRVIMLLAIGYAKDDGMIPYSQKKSVEDLRTYF